MAGRLPLLAAALLIAAPAGAAFHGQLGGTDEQRYRYVFEDIHTPFFVKEGEVYRPARPYSVAAPFAARKPDGVTRVFVIGGSVAARLTRMEHAFGPRTEVVNLGMKGYDSYRDLLAAREAAGYSPDLVVVLTGNNEFHPPARRPHALARLSPSAKRLVLRLSRAFDRAASRAPAPLSGYLWRAERRVRVQALRANVRAILDVFERRGVPVVLCTLPYSARVTPEPMDHGRSPWRVPDFAEGTAAFAAGDGARAAERLRSYNRARPGDVHGAHFLGKASELLGDFREASRWYGRAADLRFNRCGPEKNAALREECARSKNCALADLEREFSRRGRGGIPDTADFVDKVHWRAEREVWVGEAVAAAARTLRPSAARPRGAYPAAREKADTALYAVLDLIEREGEAASRNEYALDLLRASRLSPEELVRMTATTESVLAAVQPSFRIGPMPPPRGTALFRVQAHVGEALRRGGKPAAALGPLDAALSGDPSLDWARLWRGLARRALKRDDAAEDLARACAPGAVPALYARALGVCPGK